MKKSSNFELFFLFLGDFYLKRVYILYERKKLSERNTLMQKEKNYYNEIKNKLIDDEVYSKVKDYFKERHRVITYFEVGKMLTDAGKHYGKDIIGNFSKKLMIDVDKKFNSRTLRRMRQFYNLYEEQKWSTVSTKLTWSHYTELLSIKDVNKLNYYLNYCIDHNLGVRELREKIKLNEYERLPEETKIKLIENKESDIKDLIKNPIIIRNTNNYEIISEKILQKIILEDIPSFLKELGDGFTFIDNEYKIKIGSNYNYIDLLLYNYIYKSFTVVELKVTELKKEHIGQIHTYMNYIDKNLRTINEDKTIGIIICKKDNEYIMEYCSDERILSKEYELI